jgi:hypothetical protein
MIKTLNNTALKTQLLFFGMSLLQLYFKNHNLNRYKPNHNTITLLAFPCALIHIHILNPYSGCITASMASASYTSSSHLSGLASHCHTPASGHTHTATEVPLSPRSPFDQPRLPNVVYPRYAWPIEYIMAHHSLHQATLSLLTQP